MANEEQLSLLGQGEELWNKWREQNPKVQIDLRGAILEGANLSKANLSRADLRGAILSHANLRDVNLSRANLSRAVLSSANLSKAVLENAVLRGANLSSATLRDADLKMAHLFVATLSSAILRDADLRGAILEGANLSKADLCKANLRGAILSSANLSSTNLSHANLRGAILSSANLRDANLSSTNLSKANLEDANLSKADLCKAKLILSQAVSTKLMDADLTGSCILDWHISRKTNFEGVECSYIYRGYDAEKKQFSNRLPVNPDQEFKPGEFEEWIRVSAEAQQTIDLTFTEGIDWQAFFQSLQGVRQEYPDSEVGLQAIEKKGTAFVIRLKTSPDADRSAIESSQSKLYDAEKKIERAEGRIEIFQDQIAAQRHAHKDELEVVVKTMAENVGRDSDKSNPFMTFLSWFQNDQAIIAIIALVIGAASTYFIPKMFPDGFPLVDPDTQPESIQDSPSSP